MIITIADTHFGLKSNNKVIFNKQLDFFYKQLIPYIKECNEDITLIHCGDVFDNRQTIAIGIANKVQKLITDICDIDNLKEFYIISGNHDYTTQQLTGENVNSIDTIITPLKNNKLHIYTCNNIIKKNIGNKNIAFIDWNAWNLDNLKEVNEDVIICHNDIYNLSKEEYALIGNKLVISGHIHIPNFDKENLHNLGSCFSINYADSNQERYAYVYNDNWELIDKISNISSVRHWRLYNNDIETFEDKHPGKDDYIEIYIDKNNWDNKTYNESIQKINDSYSHSSTPIIIPSETEDNIEIIDTDNFNMNEFIYNCIPDNLKEEYNIIKDLYEKSR